MLFDVFHAFRETTYTATRVRRKSFYPIDMRDADNIKIVRNSYNFKYTSIDIFMYKKEIYNVEFF